MSRTPPQRLSRQAPPAMRSTKGFTLIEILVVVAIIALLVSILMPAMNWARERGRATVCSSNLRTIGQALDYYLKANEDTLPDSGGAFERIHKYVEKVGTKNSTAAKAEVEIEWYICPGDDIPHLSNQIMRTGPDGNPQNLEYELSYGINTSLVWAVRPQDDPKGIGILRKMKTVKRQSDVVSFCDSGDDDFNGAGQWFLSEWNDREPQVGHEIHHKNGNNFVYCDGHVQFHRAMLDEPPQYGLPTFARAWIPNYKDGEGGEYDDWERPEPTP